MRESTPRQSAHVIVIGNEKGGSGKSTISMHVIVHLLKLGQKVASIDLDCRQHTLTHYIENRKRWSDRRGLNLKVPQHFTPARGEGDTFRLNEEREFAQFAEAVGTESPDRIRGKARTRLESRRYIFWFKPKCHCRADPRKEDPTLPVSRCFAHDPCDARPEYRRQRALCLGDLPSLCRTRPGA